jgi:hypothetical protein
MALDEPKENDDSYEVGEFTYLINKDFMEKVKPIKVDFLDVGFKLTCGTQFWGGSACSSCSTSSSSSCKC